MASLVSPAVCVDSSTRTAFSSRGRGLSKNSRVLLVMMACLLGATALFALLLQVPAVMQANTDLFLWVNQFYWAPLAELTALLEGPDALLFGLAFVLVLAFLDRRDLALCVLIAVVIEAAFVFAAKEAVALPRPFDALAGINFAYTPSGYSFPSNHAAGAFAVFSAWCFRERRHYIVLLGFAAIIGVSRVYIGVHYPLDVVAGAMIGLIIGYSLARLELDLWLRRASTWWGRLATRLGGAGD